MWRLPAKAGFTSRSAHLGLSLPILALLFVIVPLSLATGAVLWRNTVAEKIWKLEEDYFTQLYKANYADVLALVHPQFLGWPGNLSRPIGKEESAAFMKTLIPQPTQCAIRIERAGLQQSGDTALTQYTLHVDCPDACGIVKTHSSRITHTWIRQNGQWKLLGGMSVDIHNE